MKAVSIAQFRNNLEGYLTEVASNSDTIIVTRTDEEEAVVVISLKEYNSHTETGYLLSTAANRNRLFDSIDQSENGQTQKIEL